MMTQQLKHVTVWGSLLCAYLASNVQAQLYDLSSDWSDLDNPNGAWTLYEAPGDLFDVSQPDWYGNGSNQPAWADASGPNPFPPHPLVPLWAKAVGDVGALSGDPNYTGFVDTGTVFMHSAEAFRTGTDFSSAVWTSPRTGSIHIDGGVWLTQAFQDRPHYWELRKNGAVFTGGPLTYGDGYDKTNPFAFAAGSGGPSAVDVIVAQNDEIELLIYKTGSFFTPGTLVAVNLSINLVPEPSSLISVGYWLFFSGITLRRQRAARCIKE
jgi:hypothetical protein